MSKEFEKLESAFGKQGEVSPRANAKADAMKMAMQAFEEEKIANASQGIENDTRPTSKVTKRNPCLIGRIK